MTTERKGLFAVARDKIPTFKNDQERRDFLIQLRAERDDIDSQIAHAQRTGTDLARRYRQGTREFATWLRKAETSRTIKSAQIGILETDMNLPLSSANAPTGSVMEDRRNLKRLSSAVEDALDMMVDESGDVLPGMEEIFEKLDEIMSEIYPETVEDEAEVA